MRTVHAGKHELRIAFPKGARRKGSGKIVSILHPLGEKNPECGAKLSLVEIAALDIPVSLNDEFGPAFEGTLDPEVAGQNPSGWKEKWDALRAKVAGFIAPKKKSGVRSQESGANPAKRKGNRKSKIENRKSSKRNYTEQVKTSTGKTLFVDVIQSGKRWMAEAYPVSGGKVKRVGRPIVAHGDTESRAYDALLAKVEPNPKKTGHGKRGTGNGKGKGNRKSKIENRKSRKNLDEISAAAELAGKFRGSPATKVREIELSNKQRDDYAHLGWVDQQVFHPPFDRAELDFAQNLRGVRPDLSKDRQLGSHLARDCREALAPSSWFSI